MIGNEFGKVSRWGRHAGLGLLGVLGLALFGCGGDQKVTQRAEAPLRVPVEQTATVASMSGLPSAENEAEVVPSADSLPPEIAVEVMDHVVEPGEAIEITALGSPDVREVVLSDGLGKSTSFVYDLQAKAWKAYYRAPMKHVGERLGLSVTARNDGSRWRRVWLFLQIADPALSTTSGAAAQDSTR